MVDLVAPSQCILPGLSGCGDSDMLCRTTNITVGFFALLRCNQCPRASFSRPRRLFAKGLRPRTSPSPDPTEEAAHRRALSHSTPHPSSYAWTRTAKAARGMPPTARPGASVSATASRSRASYRHPQPCLVHQGKTTRNPKQARGCAPCTRGHAHDLDTEAMRACGGESATSRLRAAPACRPSPSCKTWMWECHLQSGSRPRAPLPCRR